MGYVKVATAEIEYLVWVHPGPKSLPAVPCVFLHGVGSGATLYGRLLSHLALGRRVIAVEVPGVSQGQMSEAGSAAILDGLPQAVASALGPTTTYDVVGHSGGGWWSSVLMRAVRRRQLPAPRRLLIMQSPCFAPSFLRIMLLGQTDVRDAIPTPYIGGTWTQRVFFRLLGLCAHTVAAKDIWNIHCMNVLPQTSSWCYRKLWYHTPKPPCSSSSVRETHTRSQRRTSCICGTCCQRRTSRSRCWRALDMAPFFYSSKSG